jgi:acetyltransferase-like isoleucine patch superfamily enzyme
MRGVKMGKNVWLGYDLILDTEFPSWISLGNNVEVNMRTTIIAHFHNIPTLLKVPEDQRITVRLEDDVFIGPGVIILPNVLIGRGAAIAAGSVVTKNIPPMTLAQGNPAAPIATLGMPLAGRIDYKEFLMKLRPYKPSR